MRNIRDFGAGIIYLVVAWIVLSMASHYPRGSVLRMGPGYFPRILAFALGFVGLISVGRAFLRYGTPIEWIEIKKLAGILAAITVSGILLRGAGILIALPALILISAGVSPEFRWRPTILLIIILTLLSALIFVQGLGLPVPLLGFGGN